MLLLWSEFAYNLNVLQNARYFIKDILKSDFASIDFPSIKLKLNILKI
jgi:hypothetical protein